tara:strand:+ start:1665 stop:2741 length:1077 start_codon:yes stop_codon:yes gene_type:complete
MTEDLKNQEDQDVELHDENNESVEEAHDPKNAEGQSVKSVDKAEEATGKAKARKGDKSNGEPMQKLPKTKAAAVADLTGKISGMAKEDVMALYRKVLMAENADESDEGVAIEAKASIDYEADFSDDLNALISDEATLSEEFKDKAETIFQAAIKSKLTEEIDRLEKRYNEELTEEIESTKSELVEKVDSYLNYVVENWMEENKVAVQTGLRTEIAEKFMNNLKDLFQESYIDVPESKVDLVDELAQTVDELEERLNKSTGDTITMKEELENYKRDAIIREASRDLAETQVDKLKSLVEDIDFEDDETFAKKVQTVKESYFTKKVTPESADIEEDGDDTVVTEGSMAQYISALKKTTNK